MAPRAALLENIALKGLEIAPSQVWGAIRIVPLLRRAPRGDLRLAGRSYGEDLAVVRLDGAPQDPGTAYLSYVPHALVLSWSSDGSPAAAYGAQLVPRDGRTVDLGFLSVRLAHRMARREAPRRLRFLPLHLAMEGFLALHFGGPDIAWSEYSRHALSQGLSPREEMSFSGSWIPGLEDALRVFEIHEGQAGVLLFVADALASAFVTPHPEDYRALHRTLLEDFYGELIYQYGLLHSNLGIVTPALDAEPVSSLADLRRAVTRVREEWAAFQGFMAGGILDRPLHAERVYHAGPFHLQRFSTDLRLGAENHIGEAIVREDGTLEYLKTYRLSAAQSRRAYLLMQLAESHWNLQAAASKLGTSREELILRLEKAGFGYLLHQHVLDAARARQRGPRAGRK